MKVVNRIGVSDVLRGLKVPTVDPKTGEIKTNDKGEEILGPVDKGLPQRLYVLIGQATEEKKGTTQYGDYYEYFGTFEARRLYDGEVIKAGRMILPPPASDIFQQTFAAAKAQDPTALVNIAVVIGTEEHKHGDEVKFRYTCEPLEIAGMETVDPLEALKNALGDQVQNLLPSASAKPALPKPVKGAKAGEGSEPSAS